MKSKLGGKGANLCEMSRLGLNVPAGFTISTDVCQQFYEQGRNLPLGLWDEIESNLAEIEKASGAKFGDKSNPLLISIRSGAAVSMPGMMDSVLNVGINEEILPAIAAKGGWRFAYDCYRRLLDMMGDVVLGIDHSKFEQEISAVKAGHGYVYDVELQSDDLKEVCDRYRAVYETEGKVLPSDPREQLRMAISAVFNSWETPRAVKYREINRITGLKGTAVNVQAMAYGNLNDNCATGVCFSRNPATGEPGLYGEFLVNAQGEDVVAGIRTPLPIKQMKDVFPEAYEDLLTSVNTLENHMHDMQDMEFTIQDRQLYMLQTRNGKRTGPAALCIAVDMHKEGLVTEQEAILMVEPRHLEQLLHPMFANVDGEEYKKVLIGKGLPASPGAGSGRIVFTAEDAEKWNARGEQVVLLRMETSPEDVGGMHASNAIATARGGMTSHAAVVARGWGKPCVCGCAQLEVDPEAKKAHLNGHALKEGDWLSLNGSTGDILLGKLPTKAPEMAGNLAAFMEWVDRNRRMRVLTNCDTPKDALTARKNGAQGIGLVRTEHMFFSSAERIAAVRKMIAAEELQMDEAAKALDTLKKFQQSDFEGIYEAMDGLPVTIRLLDPPLMEFLPHDDAGLEALSKSLIQSYHAKPNSHMMAFKVLKSKLASLNEVNPMMGLRGCRLGIVFPDITKMQASAIIQAAVNVKCRGIDVKPHIMVPLVGFEEELSNQAAIIHQAAEEIFADAGTTVEYSIGTMIEVPRGALRAGDLAKHAEFFSIGSNDLTQMTLGFSRDDAEAKFMSQYLKAGILPVDPFESLDPSGVGELIRLAVERGKATRSDLEVGICGEHGGEPKSIEFVETVGLDYVSCSPLRVVVARLASAQATIKHRNRGGNDHCQD